MKRYALPLALLLVTLVGCRASGEKKGYVVLPGMYDPVAFEAYEPNPDFPDGQTLQTPPEGTVPVGWLPFPYGPGKEEAERAGRELVNPLRPTAANLARGARIFANTCYPCHGEKGEGDGPIVGRFPSPANLRADHAKEYPDGRIYHVISRGQGLMPSHALQVLPEDRWRVVLFVRQLQGKVQPIPDEPVTASTTPTKSPTATSAAAAPAAGGPRS